MESWIKNEVDVGNSNQNSIEMLMMPLQQLNSDKDLFDVHYLQKVRDSAKKLMFLTNDDSFSDRLGAEFGLRVIFAALVVLVKDEYSEIRLDLIKTVNHCCAQSQFSTKHLSEFCHHSYRDIAFKESHDDLYTIMMDALALLISTSAEYNNTGELKGLLTSLIKECSSSTPERMKGSLSALIKASSTEPLALHIFSIADDPFYDAALSPASTPLLIALLARSFSHLSPDSQPLVLDAIHMKISSWFDTPHKTRALLLLSCIFQSSPKLGAYVLMKDNLLDLLMDILEFEPDVVQISTLDVISSACSDPSVRNTLSISCGSFLMKCWGSTNNKKKAAAGLAMVKLMGLNNEIRALVMKNGAAFFGGMVNGSDMDAVAIAVEALSYLSLYSEIKNEIVGDRDLLKKFGMYAKENAVQYGIALIYFHLTAFEKQRTEEEVQIQKLQGLANPDIPKQEKIIETNEMVMKRIDILVEVGIIAAIGILGKLQSDSIRENISNVYACIATNPKHRGALIQAGSCRVLLSLASLNTPKCSLNASHALAKIGITTDPNLAFRGEMVFELVRPLLSLLDSSHNLMIFEGLMALTNITGLNDEIRSKVLESKGLGPMHECQLSDHEMVRRAATECLCNMMYHPTVFELYSTPGSRLDIMIALMDSADFATRRAASGAIAVLSSYEPNVKMLGDHGRLNEIVGELLQDANEEILHRSVEIVKNLSVGVGGGMFRKDMEGLARYGNAAIASGAREALENMKRNKE